MDLDLRDMFLGLGSFTICRIGPIMAYLFVCLRCDQVMKRSGTLRIPAMSCKAFNGRVVLEYLASVARLAAKGAVATGPRRTFGGWLHQEVQAGHRSYPSDPKLPVQAIALKPGDIFAEFPDKANLF